MPAVRLIEIDTAMPGVIVQGPAVFAEVYGADVEHDANVVGDVLRQTLELHERRPRARSWGGFLAADPDGGVVIGTCGFADGPPASDVPEIAYFTFPACEGRGYGKAMAATLLEHARASRGTRGVIAHTLPQRNASTRILESAGFTLDGEIAHAEDGVVWRWSCSFDR